ncbi:uncharacterized protein BDV17DRAFT_286658 [Aspergillus undulatus]|uniref:uncharacterized protein n=1 Tax=Aspergillus undulatus TaxID=1810928 RepID=UPI003CCE0DFB
MTSNTNTTTTTSPSEPDSSLLQGSSKSNSASASGPASKATTGPTTQTVTQYAGLGPNFAHNPQGSGLYNVNHHDEAYLQYMHAEEGTGILDNTATGMGGGKAGTGTGTGSGTKAKKNTYKTPTQKYREEWVRRALNPAISDPRGDPSPIDFECAETQRVRERV